MFNSIDFEFFINDMGINGLSIDNFIPQNYSTIEDLPPDFGDYFRWESIIKQLIYAMILKKNNPNIIFKIGLAQIFVPLTNVIDLPFNAYIIFDKASIENVNLYEFMANSTHMLQMGYSNTHQDYLFSIDREFDLQPLTQIALTYDEDPTYKRVGYSVPRSLEAGISNHGVGVIPSLDERILVGEQVQTPWYDQWRSIIKRSVLGTKNQRLDDKRVTDHFNFIESFFKEE